MFYNLLTPQASQSFCNSARLSFQALALRDINKGPRRLSHRSKDELSFEDVLISMCRNSRAINFHFNCKTQWQTCLLLYVRHVRARCKPPLFLGETLLWITRK